MKNIKITDVIALDIRFPTSKALSGSDAMNVNPDYSAAYVIVKTDHPEWEGHGLSFTIGRGNELCVAAIHALKYMILNHSLAEFTENMGQFWAYITSDSQLRWVGPEKGVIHLATAAIVNAIWDLWAKVEKKPLWRLIADLSPQNFIRCIDFKYINDVLSPEEALDMLSRQNNTKSKRIEYLMEYGYPAYSTSAGWLGYSDQKLRQLSEDFVKQGWTHLKLKVGANLNDDIRRCRIVREILGPQRTLMIDANQKWNVGEAVPWIQALAEFKPWWIEEPTHPDDILGHATIRKAVHPILVATGEHAHNRIMFKQFFQAQAIDICQIDSCRLGGVNEVLAVMLMAAKFSIPVCPHAGGVGLCNYVQHLSMVDYVCISGELKNRVIEYVDHLQEHFLDPIHVQAGRYIPPLQSGYSITIKPDSLNRYLFPEGEIWKKV